MARKKRRHFTTVAETEAPESTSEPVATIAEEEVGEFEAILNLNPDGLLVIHPETREVHWANKTAERLLRSKSDKLLAEPFPEELEDGQMRNLDLKKKVHPVRWQGEDRVLVTLTPVQAGGASFSLEWRLEAAEERARESEQQVEELQQQLRDLRKQLKEAKKDSGSGDREKELHAELEKALQRAETLESDMRAVEERAERAEERMREAESLMEGAESQAQEAERHLEDLSDTIRQLEDQLEQVRRSGETDQQVITENSSLREQVQVLQSEIDDLLHNASEFDRKKSAWEQREAEIEELELVHLQLMTELEQLRVEKQTWQETTEANQGPPGELQALQDQLRESQERLDLLEIERAELEEKLVESQAEAAARQEALEQEAEKLREAARFADEELQSVQQLMDEEADLRLEAEKQREQALKKVAELEARQQEGAAFETQLEELQRELNAAREELEQARSSDEQHLDAELQLRHELDELRQQLQSVQAERDELSRRAEESDNDLHQHLAQVEKERDDLLRRLDAADARTATLQEQQGALQGELEAAEQRVTELERRYEEKAAEAEAEASALLDLENQLNDLQDRLSARESSEPAIQAELQDAQRRAESLEMERDLLQSEVDSLQTQVAQRTAEVEASQALALEIENLRAQAEQLQQQLTGKEQEAGELSEQLMSLRQQAAEAEQLRSELAFFSEQVAESARLTTELEQARERAQQAVALEEELSALREQAEGQAALLQELEQLRIQASEFAEVSAELEQARARLLESQEALQELERVRGELATAREQFSAAQQPAASDAAAEELGARVTELEAALESARLQAARIPELEMELQGALERASQAADSAADRARIAELEAEMEALKAAPATATMEDGTAAARIVQLEQQVAELEAQLATAPTAKLEDGGAAARVQELERQLAEALQGQGGPPAPPASGADKETEQLAFEDTLTKLPNMNLLRRYLDYSLKQVDRYQRRCALIHVDVDRFTALNEALGPNGGDEVLIQVAQRLQTVVRTSDVLCRKSEDDFLILLSEVAGDESNAESISIVLRRIQEVLGPPLQAGNQPVLISASIGVSQFPSDAQDADQMLRHAKDAMRRAKELGRNQVQFYTEELQKRHDARSTLEAELRKALDSRQFHMLYQPIVHLPTGRVAGVEGLLRWNHPTYGTLTPEYFLDVADETGLLNPIGRWTIQTAAAQLAEWARHGLDVFVTVNLSTRQFLQADLVETLRRTLESTGAPAHNFVVEVPESVQMLDIQRVQGILLALRQAGIRVALDRFGSGFSSLERLHSELITLMKIDRKFLFHAATNAAALNVTVAALGLARGLRLRPVAVGVENETQLELCRKLECEYVQGNLVYVPTEASQVTELARMGRLLR